MGDKKYLEPKHFTELLITYQKTGDDLVLMMLIVRCFYPIACGVIRRFRYKFVDPEDALQTAVSACVAQINRFDIKHQSTNIHSSNIPCRKAFSFFTTCIVNAYKGLYRQELGEIRKRRSLLDVESDRFYRNNPNIKSRRYRDDNDDDQQL